MKTQQVRYISGFVNKCHISTNFVTCFQLRHDANVSAGSSSRGIVRRALSVLGSFVTRPVPSVRPEPLPSLPPRGSPRRPTTMSPLRANRDSASGVRRARDRAQRIPGSRLNRSPCWGRPFGRPDRSPQPIISPLAAQRSWVRNTNENMPWDSPNQAPSLGPSSPQMPSAGAGERRLWSATRPAVPTNTSRGPPSHSDGMYIDRNTIRSPTSPTPLSGRGQRTRVTNHNITAATLQGNPEQGVSPPTFIEHAGDGPIVGPRADPNGLPTDLPAWQWMPQDNVEHRLFVEDDRSRVNRGDIARLIAHRLYNQLVDSNVGEGAMMDLYQLLRNRYEWGLTHDYRFKQYIPGYYRQPVPARTPPLQRYRPYYGGPGTVPGYLNLGQPDGNVDLGMRPESGGMYCGASASAEESPFFVDSRPDPNLLNRAKRPPSWGSWNGGANGGNQNFDLYVSPSNGSDQRPSVGQTPRSSIDARREPLGERCGENQAGGGSSISTLELPSPLNQGQCTTQQKVFPGSSSGFRQENGSDNEPPPGAPCPNGPGGPPNTGWGRRTSGGSSLGGMGSQKTLKWPSCSHDGSQLAASGSLAPSSFASQASGSSTSRGRSSQATGMHASCSCAFGNQTTDNQKTPTREQYTQMTAQQLRDEIIARGGDPPNPRQRKEDLVQALLGYDGDGVYGNGAQPRRRAPAIPPHPTLSPRALRPRDNGKAVRK